MGPVNEKQTLSKVSVVIPAFNEQGNISAICQRLEAVLSPYPAYEILFVDDGSQDETLAALRAARAANKRVRFLSLSRNFGHQQALKAGLDNADGDCVVSMDCDLQHPPELIPQMIEKWREGYDIVLTQRQDDPRVALPKRATARLFYALINRISDVHIEPGAADFRLLDRKVVDVMRSVADHFLFVRGLIPWLGFHQFTIPYMPDARVWGQSKYSLHRMIRFAVDGVTSSSIKPLQLSTTLGSIFSVVAFLYACYAIALKLFTNQTVEGWTSVLVSVLFLGGIQLVMIGIVGTYLGRVFVDGRSRPTYIIKEASHE